MQASSGLGSQTEDICSGLLETETYDLLSIPPCLVRLTTTLPPLNETLNGTLANETESEEPARRKRLVRRQENVRRKRTLMTVCDETFVFGIFHQNIFNISSSVLSPSRYKVPRSRRLELQAEWDSVPMWLRQA